MLKQIPDKSKPAGLALFADYSESFHHKVQVPQTPKIPPFLREFYNPKLREEQIKNQVKSVHEVKLSPGQIKFVEKSTVLRNNSIVWKSLPAARITESNVQDVLHTDQNNPAKSLIKKLCTKGKNLDHVPAIKWGCENESNTLKAYQKKLECCY